jgi:hypothetical protein
MGQLLDALSAVDADIAASNKPALPVDEPMSEDRISSVVDEATESVIGAADRITSQTPPTPRQPDTTLAVMSKLVRQAPLQSLAVAFLVGIAVARRR